MIGYSAERSYRPEYWSQPRTFGLHLRDRSASDFSLRTCSCQLRISVRIALPALSATAGLKLMKHFPFQCLDLRGRNV